MNFKRTLCLILAILLTACAVLLLFPEWLFSLYPSIDFEGTIVNLEEIDMNHFPFYGKKDASGIRSIVNAYKGCVLNSGGAYPHFPDLLSELVAHEDILQALYTFLLVSLLTIPVYMLMRLIVFDAAYEIADITIFPLRFFVRGFIAAMASLCTVFITWFLYRTVVFDIVVRFLMEKLENLTTVQFALNATNIFMLVVIAVAVIALLRATLFRGSIFTSILGALLRTLLFIVIVSAIDVFSAGVTLRFWLFFAAAILAVGILKTILLPEKRTVIRTKRS